MTKKQAVVVIDTNVWVYSTKLLSTSLGAAILFAIKRNNLMLVLPEVIEQEIRKHTAKKANEAVQSIHENYHLIEQLMGARDDYKVPDVEEVKKRVDSRFEELGDILVKKEFTLQHARNALSRVMNETPPNKYKDQQFKDSAIWELILDIANESDVHFVTNDKAFFENRNPDNGLAENLAAEIDGVLNTIAIYYGVGEFIERINGKLSPIHDVNISISVNQSLSEIMNKESADRNYQLFNLDGHNIKSFYTEASGILAIEFVLKYKAKIFKIEDQNVELDALCEVSGDCAFDIINNQSSNIELSHILVTDCEGNKISEKSSFFLKGSDFCSGRKTIKYKLKHPIES